MKKPERIEQLLGLALDLARETHYMQVRITHVAERAGVTYPLVSQRIGTLSAMRRNIMRAAIVREDLAVLGQGLLCKDPHATKAPPELQERALAQVAKDTAEAIAAARVG